VAQSLADVLAPGGEGSCATAADCKRLLIRGQALVIGDVPVCMSCRLPGCRECGINGTTGNLSCTRCQGHFENVEGVCKWAPAFWTYFLFVLVGLLGCVCLWVLVDAVRSELRGVTNEFAMSEGFLARRRAQFFQLVEEGGTKVLRRYHLLTNLNSVASREIAGPGHTLFMNWFPFIILLSAWMGVIAAIFSPEDELREADPCLHPDLVQSGEMAQSSRARWLAILNYAGATALSLLFLIYQEHIWSEMVYNKERPSLQSYCVRFSGLPCDMTDRQMFEASLREWLQRLHLDVADSICEISFGYNARGRQDELQRLVDRHLQAASRQRSFSREEPEPHGHSDLEDPGPFWVRVVAAVLHGTPLEPETLCCCWPFGPREQAARVEPVGGGEERELLGQLEGSGEAFVVLYNEALANAVAGGGYAQLKGLVRGDPERRTEVRVRKAQVEPENVRWKDFAPKPIWEHALKAVVVAVVLYASLVIWLSIFSAYLSFELVTAGSQTLTRDFVSTFVIGLAVPAGNAFFGVVVGELTERYGFRNQENVRLASLVLNCFINLLANFGEVVMIYNKVYYEDELAWSDLFGSIFVPLSPLGLKPASLDFMAEVQGILVPAGLFVPSVLVPFAENVLPLLVGRARLKNDARLKASDAERMLAPKVVELQAPYGDIIVNVSLLSLLSFFAPGSYLAALWLAVAAWTLIVWATHRMYVLRWQAYTVFGGRESDKCAATLLAIPLSFLAGRMNLQLRENSSGIYPMLAHAAFHAAFVHLILPRFEPYPRGWVTSYEERVQDLKAPAANYENTNPVEVLKRSVAGLPDGAGKLTLFRCQQWYLLSDASVFAGEECARQAARGSSVLTGVRNEAGVLFQDLSSASKTVWPSKRFSNRQMKAAAVDPPMPRAGEPPPTVLGEQCETA